MKNKIAHAQRTMSSATRLTRSHERSLRHMWCRASSEIMEVVKLFQSATLAIAFLSRTKILGRSFTCLIWLCKDPTSP